MSLPRDDPERPPRRLPRIPQRSVRTQKEADAPGGVPLHGDAGHSVVYQLRSEKGQASGYAGLDAANFVDSPIKRLRSGLAAARPTSGDFYGDCWWAYDTAALSLWDGSAWQSLAAGGGDPDAIHDNVAAEISAITEKVTPVAADLVVIEDSESAGPVNQKKRVQVGNLPGGPPSGPAGGELGGTYPSPTVDSVHGPEALAHHAQNSDTGTTQASFIVGQGSALPKIGLVRQSVGSDFTQLIKPAAALSASHIVELPNAAGTVALTGDAPTAHKSTHASGGGDALFSSQQYVFLPDAAIDADVVAGAQKQILVSAGANETLARIVIHATAAGGTALTVTLEQLQSGGVGVEDTDSAGTWTTIKAITVTASNKTVIDSAPAATILARGALRINIGGTVTGWKNVSANYEVKRPLTT